MNRPIIVLKFGSSVLRTGDDLPKAVHEIYRYVREGLGVVAVVSAFNGVTDRLMAQATSLGADPAQDVGITGLTAFVAAGEREAAASLQIALSRAGLAASVLDPLAAGLRVDGTGLCGSPVDLAVERLRSLLHKGRILVVPGFFGSDEDGGVSLLGRGGSDWTALFLAQRLGARCRLLKDTGGIYEHDPKAAGESPERFVRLHFDDAVALRAEVVQEKALRFAASCGQAFEVARMAERDGTIVGPHPTRLWPGRAGRSRPLRVTLLGLGTVGRGVCDHLLLQPELFEIAAVAVRDPARHAAGGPPGAPLVSIEEAIHAPADVVVEAIGGVNEAGEALSRALLLGRHVVTANKAVIAAHGPTLQATAQREGRRLLYSAAVGGVMPVLETLRGLRGSVSSIEGVLNGTSNFVLDRVFGGATAAEALGRARELGYAEADPSDDLSGLDTARKLILMAGEAFGATIEVGSIPLPPAGALTAWRPEGGGGIPRLVGRLATTEAGCEASVRLEALDSSHPLARCRGADNAVIITLRGGEVVSLGGRGAGRWPTAESVMGDLFELWRGDGPCPVQPRSLIGRWEEQAS